MYQGMGEPLYDADIRVWGGQQADPLRRLAAGERVNTAADWANLIDDANDRAFSSTKVQSVRENASAHPMARTVCVRHQRLAYETRLRSPKC